MSEDCGYATSEKIKMKRHMEAVHNSGGKN